MAIKETVEREVKLRAGDAFRLPELGGEAIEPRLFVSTYHDTADHRLGRRGITLRHRVENGKGLWQLKLQRAGARLELEEPGPPVEPPEELRALLIGHLRGVSLVPIARLRTRREGVVADGAEVVHDTVSVLDHQRVTRSFEELEVELLDGDEKTLRRLEKALRRAGAVDGENRPKVFQALDLDFQPDPLEDGHDGSASGSSALASASRSSSCSPTIPGRGSAPSRRSCTSCASRPGVCGHSFAPAATCSTLQWQTRSRRSFAGSGAHSGRFATSMS